MIVDEHDVSFVPLQRDAFFSHDSEYRLQILGIDLTEIAIDRAPRAGRVTVDARMQKDCAVEPY